VPPLKGAALENLLGQLGRALLGVRLVEEALAGQSRADFLSKMSIASKEARETKYWLRLIRDSKTIANAEVEPLITESEAIANILTSIVKTTSVNNSKLKIQNSKSKTQNHTTGKICYTVEREHTGG
jgi:four helix bundle protein